MIDTRVSGWFVPMNGRSNGGSASVGVCGYFFPWWLLFPFAVVDSFRGAVSFRKDGCTEK